MASQQHKKNSSGGNLKKLVIIVWILVLILAAALCSILLFGKKQAPIPDSSSPSDTGQHAAQTNERETEEVKRQEEQKKKEEEAASLVQETDRLALGYFYQDAIEKVKSFDQYENYPVLTDALSRYQSQLDSLVPYEGDVSHVFFHSLIADTSKAFDGDSMENGYNYWMTTVSEFNKMMEQMYKRGYVLVDIHDVAGPVEQDGKTVYRKKEILLPEGKIPFVLSQDDVSYYNYMKNDGFAKRIVLDENGKPACEMIVDGKSVIARDFDVVPLLDVFVEQHPDFSYQGTKGILALTGYEGALGYRVNDEKNENLEADKEAVRRIAAVLKDGGWSFASHGYGHRHMDQISYDLLKEDCKKWRDTIGVLIGGTDVYIYPYGEEIDYTTKKYTYMKEKMGFNYFCGVYAYPWIQIHDDYVRMTRRNLDGFTMYFYPKRTEDLFDVTSVYDPARPPLKE
ncbi:polysaccharide deacetylase [Anaerolentibacter hominis]|uniref:polysaccharide deacetylase n=1 Tax=Anaerolentibacter hominis TaxID=3079009 RepID=UPI0031B86D8E